MAIGYGGVGLLWPQSLLWNARLLPFIYLTRYLLAAIGVAEIVAWSSPSPQLRRRRRTAMRATWVVAASATPRRGQRRSASCARPRPPLPECLPFASSRSNDNGKWVYDWPVRSE